MYATPGPGNCFKPFLALRQLGLGMRMISVDVLAGEARAPRFLALKPVGGVPLLVTADGTGLSGSNAMLWPVGEGSGLMPQDALARAQSLQWMFFEQMKLEPHISPARFFGRLVPERGRGREAEMAAWRARGAAGLALLEAHLRGRDVMLGDCYGITDIAIFGYVHVAEEAEIDMRPFPAIRSWIHRVQQTPGFVPLSAMGEAAIPFACKAGAD
ncbi:glutathione S-transferase family protein [Falsiroseomonas tokyonensis]|uniref:glutathione S-transferase family protein n=1 Tax=Falsiroseomonas tokyonensis TaxID=430521 RepID=UPI001C205B3D|nr:glutathione S-transferase family protein [Falsiroseomonas tokyonensis]